MIPDTWQAACKQSHFEMIRLETRGGSLIVVCFGLLMQIIPRHVLHARCLQSPNVFPTYWTCLLCCRFCVLSFHSYLQSELWGGGHVSELKYVWAVYCESAHVCLTWGESLGLAEIVLSESINNTLANIKERNKCRYYQPTLPKKKTGAHVQIFRM